MAYDEKRLVPIFGSEILLLLLPQLRNMAHHHQIIFGCKIFIQAGTYQDSHNHWKNNDCGF